LIPGKKTTLVLQRFTNTADGLGGFSDTWEDKRSISGVLTPMSGNKQILYDRLGVVADQTFFVDIPVGLTITEHDRFRNGAIFYQIKYKKQWDHHIEFALETGKGKNST
jgi:hypothetical protein